MSGGVRAPLEDPACVPEHPPVNGAAPDVVAKWRPRSQLRWFNRFDGQLKPQPYSFWERFYCSSEDHRGQCCSSCIEDWWAGYSDIEKCCCRAIKPEGSEG